MEETRRLREPAAWLLLVLTFVTVVAGIVQMLVGSALDSFQARALAASSGFLGIVPVALPFAAVLLATRFGPLLARARLIVIGALSVQGLAALFGLIAWIGGSFGGGTSINLLVSQFLGGALWLALLGLAGFYAITVLRAPELRPAPKPQPQQGFAPHPGYPGGPYPGMPPGPPPGQPGQPVHPGAVQPGQPGPPPGYGGPQPGYPSGQQAPMPGYPSGQQAPMPGYQPHEYAQPESTYQMPAVGDPEETHNFGAQQQGQPGYPQPDAPLSAQPGVQPGQPSGPQFGAPGQGPAGPGGQQGWPGGYGQPQSGPQGPAQQSWPGAFGQSGPQQPEQPEPYGQGAYGAAGGMGAFGHQEPSPYQEPSYQEPSPYQEPQPGYGQQAGQGGQEQPSGESSGFDALFGQRNEGDSPEDVQRTYRIPHDPEAFRNGGYQPPSGEQH